MASNAASRARSSDAQDECAIPALRGLHQATRLCQADFERQSAILGGLVFLALISLFTAVLCLCVVLLEMLPLLPGPLPNTYTTSRLDSFFLLALRVLPGALLISAGLLALSRRYSALSFQRRWDSEYRPARQALEHSPLCHLLADDALWREAIAAHREATLVKLPSVFLPRRLEQQVLLVVAAWTPLLRYSAGEHHALRQSLVETLLRYSVLLAAARRGAFAGLQSRARIAAVIEFASGWGDAEALQESPQLELRPLCASPPASLRPGPYGYDYRLRAREDRVYG